jgi:hypothetical protein
MHRQSSRPNDSHFEKIYVNLGKMALLAVIGLSLFAYYESANDGEAPSSAGVVSSLRSLF